MSRTRDIILPLIVLAAGFTAIATTTDVAHTQGRWQWPDTSENLKVLPKDTSADALRARMVGFANALGVRCSYCHVGEAGAPLGTYDFPSDDVPEKDIAREMIRMMGSIGDHLGEIREANDRAVDMSCYTCHRGRPRPYTLGEELTLAYKKEGVDAAIARYNELRAEYYGRGSFDFGEETLASLGFDWLDAGNRDAAIAVLVLNVEQYPESATAVGAVGQAYMQLGEKQLAIEYFEKALAIDPENPRFRAAIDRLEKM